jgi:hypothetical protein
MSIPRDAANRITEQSQMHDLRESNKSLDIAPVTDAVVVQV